MQRIIRQDIQFLRGLAVVAVVVFHTRLGIMKGGYLGVDIFFVISGFLITGMIANQVRQNQFSFKEFYFRRAKRLLPAAYVTFAVTAIVSSFVLTSEEFRAFRMQCLGAVTYTANIVLFRQGSYFGGDAELKPLLHAWSLSVEEQYYVIIPPMLYFIPDRWWTKFAITAALISFTVCIAAAFWQPSFAFYMFPTRAWEMAIGSIGALSVNNTRLGKLARLLFWPSVIALVVILFEPVGGIHPGFDSLVACLATFAIILRQPTIFDAPLFRPMTWAGDISYSLYLVHWPLFALTNNLWIGHIPMPVTLGLIVISFLLAWLQYHLIEQPVHHAKFGFTWARAGMMAAISVIVIAIPSVAILAGRAPLEMVSERRGNTGLGANCVSNRAFNFLRECATSSTPTILVWGDSYAMHLVPGIVQERGAEQIAQATKYICGPLIGVSPLSHQPGAGQNRYWADGCLQYNRDVLKYIANTSSIKIVILASVFDAYMTDGINLYSAERGEYRGGVAATVDALQMTIVKLRALGKRVVVVGPPPALKWDAGLCTERRLRKLPTFGRYKNCNIPDRDYRVFRGNVLRFLNEVEKKLDVNVITFDEYLRRGDHYVTAPTDKIWFITNGHLSYQGSRDIVRGMDMVPTAVATAR
ncbi:conserved membrane hypothetical protein [Sphingomonas aurantiaca]|uniref:Acyltransferase n=1 Tax=Sphingomonas aurantiaca TaxID=185949 RepID=A0A5E8ALT8_9SPHN|nr:acyltransferase family protein [Sphingomonas aurantiaca]VVT32332.1 conserved membrane hypothetical protein [Sphingomonas aurantiaca]